MAGSLRDLIPDDHILARVDRLLDLIWLRAEVRSCYAADGAGRPGIDPEVAVRLMLAGFLLGIVHDRRLMREAQVNMAIRWFAGFGLHEVLPDHSSLTRSASAGVPICFAKFSPARLKVASPPESPRARWCISMPR
jgi:transposase